MSLAAHIPSWGDWSRGLETYFSKAGRLLFRVADNKTTYSGVQELYLHCLPSILRFRPLAAPSSPPFSIKSIGILQKSNHIPTKLFYYSFPLANEYIQCSIGSTRELFFCPQTQRYATFAAKSK
jgi:hypothetical protein